MRCTSGQPSKPVQPAPFRAAGFVCRDLAIRVDASARAPLKDDARALYLGAASLCQLGEKARSLEWAKMALVIDPEDAGILYNVACVYSLQGQVEEAIECLEKAMVHGFWYKQWAQRDPDLNLLRDHPRFLALMKKG